MKPTRMELSYSKFSLKPRSSDHPLLSCQTSLLSLLVFLQSLKSFPGTVTSLLLQTALLVQVVMATCTWNIPDKLNESKYCHVEELLHIFKASSRWFSSSSPVCKHSGMYSCHLIFSNVAHSHKDPQNSTRIRAAQPLQSHDFPLCSSNGNEDKNTSNIYEVLNTRPQRN